MFTTSGVALTRQNQPILHHMQSFGATAPLGHVQHHRDCCWVHFQIDGTKLAAITRRTGPLAGKNVIRFGSEASRSRTLTVKAYSLRFKPVLIPPCSICFVPLLHTLVDVWVHLVALLTIDPLGDPKRVVFVPSTILNANKVANFPFYLARDLGRDARPQLAPASNPSASASRGARRTRS